MIREWLGRQISGWAAERLMAIGEAIYAALPDIITIGIIFCALAMMIPGTDTRKWFNMIVAIFWSGVSLIIIG